MGGNIDQILTEIDSALADLPSVEEFRDQQQLIEDEVWTTLVEDIDIGIVADYEDAISIYTKWRESYRIGSLSVYGTRLA